MKALIVTGEASGDLYGGRLAESLRRRLPTLQLAGMGGSHMEQAGVELLYHYGHVAVVGIFEVLGKLQHLRAAYRNIRQWVTREKPAFAVLIDFPDFNFRVARFLKSQGIKTFYFISPQVWAWRKGRVRFLRDHVDLMISILPFEKSLYEKAGVPVEYVGHPLVEIVRSDVAQQPELPCGNVPRLGLMPGSREVEVRRHLPVLLDALKDLQRQLSIEPLLMWPPSLPLPAGVIPPEVRVISENRYAAMKSCDLLLVASGTSTLECAILGAPLLIVYKVTAVSWWLGKILVRIPYYGLVNWVAGRKIVPEFIQDRMSPSILAREALAYLKDSSLRKRMKEDLAAMVETLGPPGAIERAVDTILSRVNAAD
ncbi:MAG TPA: lipid-A-disaccharide synthase [Acidobacteriota bacterium]|nr:lipid-A-disaccharide synthase [Acidobacteriota bacterium]